MISNLDPQLRERLENIVAMLCVEIETLMDDEADIDKNAALIAMSNAVETLEDYLYPELADDQKQVRVYIDEIR
jgi:DNA repair exonuclease SbcCD nuclease subunit